MLPPLNQNMLKPAHTGIEPVILNCIINYFVIKAR